jgi:hypothetical protein
VAVMLCQRTLYLLDPIELVWVQKELTLVLQGVTASPTDMLRAYRSLRYHAPLSVLFLTQLGLQVTLSVRFVSLLQLVCPLLKLRTKRSRFDSEQHLAFPALVVLDHHTHGLVQQVPWIGLCELAVARPDSTT